MPKECEVPPAPPAPSATIPARLRPSDNDEFSWTSLARLVRQEDEDKVQKCHEKVNTCLLFSFFLSSQSANTTAVPVSVPAATTSPTATHVAALWTTSLAVSIIAASLRSLLQQWLFAYVISHSSSPQDDLHARYTRRSKRGLLELVALLPLLLQISMALFFAGLLPSYSQSESCSWLCCNVACCRLGFYFRVSHRAAGFITPKFLQAAIHRVPHRWHQAFHLLVRYFVWQVPPAVKVDYTWESIVMKQARAAKCEDADIDMLVPIYSGATPEALLGFVKKIIVSAYPTSRWQAQSYSKTATAPVAAMSLRSLPKSAHTTIVENIGDLLLEDIRAQTGGNDTKAIEWSSWMKEALRFILADSSHPIPPRANVLLVKLMNEDRADEFLDLVLLLLGDQTSQVFTGEFAYILSRLSGACELLKTRDVAPCLSALLRQCFCNRQANESKHDASFLPLLKAHISNIPPGCPHAIALLLHKRLTNDISPSMFRFASLVDIVEVLLYVDNALPPGQPEYTDLHAQLVKLTRRLLFQQKNTSIYLRYTTGQSQDDEDELKSASRLFIDAFVSSTPFDRRLILRLICFVHQWQLVISPEEEDNSWDKFVRPHVTKTYLLVLKAIEELKDPKFAESLQEGLSVLRFYVAGSLRSKIEVDPLAGYGSPEKDDAPDSSVPDDSAKVVDVDGAKTEIGDNTKGAPEARDDEVKDGEQVVTKVKRETSDADDHEDKPKDAKVVPKVPSAKDIDIAKRCLSLVTSFEAVAVTQDTGDEEFTTTLRDLARRIEPLWDQKVESSESDAGGEEIVVAA
ncbi:hypothetical protein BC835DRAFT_1412570 [Cytidiella melzeri]|nr:hypothetical protein BC835DRAFT_1412570 [Cytidiella melzeri]